MSKFRASGQIIAVGGPGVQDAIYCDMFLGFGVTKRRIAIKGPLMHDLLSSFFHVANPGRDAAQRLIGSKVLLVIRK